MSQSLVQWVWARVGIKPHRMKRYMASDDPDFEKKAADVTGLYITPPQHAAIFSLDEKTAIQALDRLDPVLPLSSGRLERHGFRVLSTRTPSLYAALNTRTGKVLGDPMERHTSEEFVGFLRQIVASQPRGREIHIVLDNLSTHKTWRVEQFLADHKNVHLHFTPTYSSWLNQVEIWFSKIKRHVIARGVFTSFRDLARKIMRYIKHYNRAPKPIKCTCSNPKDRIRATVSTEMANRQGVLAHAGAGRGNVHTRARVLQGLGRAGIIRDCRKRRNEQIPSQGSAGVGSRQQARGETRKMKKLGVVSLSVLAVVSAFGLLSRTEAAHAGAHYVNPCLKSTLCSGLAEYFDLGESSDSPRVGAFGTLINEPAGGNVGTRLGKGGAGTTAIDLAGSPSSHLWRSFSPGPAGFYTVALWLYPDTAGTSGQYQYILSWDSQTRRGPSLYLYNNAGTLQITHQAIEAETGNIKTATQNISASAWHLVVFGASSYLDGGTNTPNIFLSVDNAAKTTTTIGYFTQPGERQFRIGCRPWNGPSGACDLPFDGGIDNIALWGRTLTASEIALLWNGGSGQTYPYSTEQATTYTFYQYPASVQYDNWPYNQTGSPSDVDDFQGANDGNTTVMTFEGGPSPTYRTGSYHFNLTPPEAGVTINWIKLHLIQSRRTAGQCFATWDNRPTQVTPRTRVGSTEYDGTQGLARDSYNQNTSSWDGDAAGHCDSSGGNFNELIQQWTTNPATGTAWTSADLTSLGIGWYVSVSYVDANQGWYQVTSVYLEVNATTYQ